MLNRKIAPPFVKTSSFSLLTPEESTLSNGTQMLFVSGGFQDVIKIELIFEAGKWFEERNGAAYFMSHLLSKGTEERSSFEIATIFDRYGAHLEASPGVDFVSLSLYALTKQLSPVLDMLMELLSAPTFPENEFRLAQDVFIQNLRVNNEKTSYVASRFFRRNLFGEKHPYGNDAEELEARALETADIKKHFAKLLHSATVFVSGKIEAESRDRILKAFGTLRSGKPYAPPPHAIDTTPKNEHVEKKDAVQSSVRIGKRSVLRSHADYVSVLFVSHILGGYFGSRLMKNIREEKGLTYGISASLHALKHDSYLVIGADVNKENTRLIFDEIRKELKHLRTTLISSSELETTRNHFIGSLQSEITTPFAHADKIKTIRLFDLPADHYNRMIRKIQEITPSEIARTTEVYFHEDTFFETAVG